ncbi:hypothetical protein [Stieleria varia]|uniref:Uncharacterized protein n=1 Tax=Stieleria varia TaxID=2528005 RepID=A0A5C5ZLS9_9BACT|nr:hypothetical protein [Stieleria varia]TWT86997.1 hypothetical protein Pla52n_70540 [Stieleria varia]TWT87791.1 hypothetical protein Pla52n_69850 [Stieleria varia]
MKITSFTDTWYPECMNQVRSSFSDDVSLDAAAIADAIMVAGAFIAQSIDNSIGHTAEGGNGSTLLDAINNLGRELNDIADKFVE